MKLKNIEITEIAGKQVIIRQGQFAVDMTKIIAFNKTAKRLWEQLKDIEFAKQDVVNLLIQNYNIEQVEAKHDAEIWINQCVHADLIEE